MLIGSEDFIEDAVKDIPAYIPAEYFLSHNYPNPFNPVTYINFHLPYPGKVQLTIYNILGQKVRKLIDSYYDAGVHRVQWDGCNESGFDVASGLYIYRIQSGNFCKTLKMLKIK